MENTEISSKSPDAHGVDVITTPRSGLNGDKDENCAMDTSSTPITKSGITIVPDEANPLSKNLRKLPRNLARSKPRTIKGRKTQNLIPGRGGY